MVDPTEEPRAVRLRATRAYGASLVEAYSEGFRKAFEDRQVFIGIMAAMLAEVGRQQRRAHLRRILRLTPRQRFRRALRRRGLWA